MRPYKSVRFSNFMDTIFSPLDETDITFDVHPKSQTTVSFGLSKEASVPLNLPTPIKVFIFRIF